MVHHPINTKNLAQCESCNDSYRWAILQWPERTNEQLRNDRCMVASAICANCGSSFDILIDDDRCPETRYDATQIPAEQA